MSRIHIGWAAYLAAFGLSSGAFILLLLFGRRLHRRTR